MYIKIIFYIFILANFFSYSTTIQQICFKIDHNVLFKTFWRPCQLEFTLLLRQKKGTYQIKLYVNISEILHPICSQ